MDTDINKSRFELRSENTKSWCVTILLLSLIYSGIIIVYNLIPVAPSYYYTMRDLGIMFCMAASAVFFVFNKIGNKYLRNHLAVFLLYYMFLTAFSFIKYGSIVVYPHTILYLSNFFYIITFYAVLAKYADVSTFARRLVYSVCAFLLFYEALGRFFGAVPYSNILEINRFIPAGIMLLMLFVTLYLVTEYIFVPRLSRAVIILICLALFIVEGQRSIWASGIAAFAAFTYLITKTKKASLKIIYVGLIIFIIMAVAIYVLSLERKECSRRTAYLKERFEEIYRFREYEGTGMFRYKQYLYYFPYIKENLLFGLRFKGFELPQVAHRDFYADMTGHHFHSGYLNVLFYHGIFGFLLLYAPAFYYLIAVLRRKKYTLLPHLTLFPFIVGGLVFSLVYQLPSSYFAMVGMGVAFLEKKEEEITEK